MSIVDVAKLAKVSTATVSRVMNNHAVVDAQTGRRVRAAMKELGYVPRAIRPGPKARLPRLSERPSASTGTLGLLLAGRSRKLLRHPQVARLLEAMTAAAQTAGRWLTIIEMPDLATAPRILRDRGVDGLIVFGAGTDPAWFRALLPLPLVACGGEPQDQPLADMVCTNNPAISHLAADYLRRRGCRQVAFLNHNPSHGALATRGRRFQEYLHGSGLKVMMVESPCPEPVSGDELWTAKRVRADMEPLLDRALAAKTRPDGYFLPTDQQAAVVHHLLRERGFRPGVDVPLISCGNDAPWLATMNPRTATIDPGVEMEGREAVRRLLARIDNPFDDPVVTLTTPRLIEE